MQSIKQILEELGFNPGSSIETQKAFVKHLLYAAKDLRAPETSTKVQPPVVTNDQAKIESKSKQLDQSPVQLEFDFDKDKRVS